MLFDVPKCCVVCQLASSESRHGLGFRIEGLGLGFRVDMSA